MVLHNCNTHVAAAGAAHVAGGFRSLRRRGAAVGGGGGSGALPCPAAVQQQQSESERSLGDGEHSAAAFSACAAPLSLSRAAICCDAGPAGVARQRRSAGAYCPTLGE